MNAPTSVAATEAALRAQLEDWASAVRARDVERIFTFYAPEIVAFDAIAELQFKGAEAYRRHWEACMKMCTGPMIFELHEVDVTAGDELAFARALNRCGGTGPDGREMSGWMRMTVCLRRQNGQWQVVHEHFSAPFDPQTDQALWLQP